jgi:hypothetical protein
MKQWAVWVVMVGMAMGAMADELLDEVLRWDQPAAWMKGERRATPPGVPARAKPEVASPDSREERLIRRLEAAERRAAEAEARLSPKGSEIAEVAEQSAAEKAEDSHVEWMDRAVKLALRGGGEVGALAFSGEFTIPLGKSAFDLSLRGFYLRHDLGENRDGDSMLERNAGGDAWLIWHPIRMTGMDLFAGVGGRFERMSHSSCSMEYDRSFDDQSCSPAGRVGLILRYPQWKRVSLKAEIIAGSESNELFVEGLLHLGQHLEIGPLVERFEAELGDATVIGVAAGLLF